MTDFARSMAGSAGGRHKVWTVPGQVTITPVKKFDPPAAVQGKRVKEISGKFWPDGNR
jgi:hypothetical protein